MSHIIRKKVGKTTYVYEEMSYRENGKVRTKQKILGKLDESSNLIPSKRRLASSEPKVEGNDKIPTIPVIPEVLVRY